MSREQIHAALEECSTSSLLIALLVKARKMDGPLRSSLASALESLIWAIKQ